MDAHEVLVKARNIINREGWTCGVGHSDGNEPGAYQRSRGYCVNGALGRALGLDVKDAHVAMGVAPSMGPALDVLRDQLGHEPWVWNDEQCKTKEAALAAFDEAIRRTAPEPQDPFASVPLDFSPEAALMP